MKYIKEFKIFETISYKNELKKYGLKLITNNNGDIIVKDGKLSFSIGERTVPVILKLYDCGFTLDAKNIFRNNKFSYEHTKLLCFVVTEDKFAFNGVVMNYKDFILYLDKLKSVTIKEYIGLNSMNTNYADYIKEHYDDIIIDKKNNSCTFKYNGWVIDIYHVFDMAKNLGFIRYINIFGFNTTGVEFDIFIGMTKDEFDTKMKDLIHEAIYNYYRNLYGDKNIDKDFIIKQIDGIIGKTNSFHTYPFEVKTRIINILLELGKYEEFLLTQLIKDDELFHLVKNKLSTKLMNKYLEMINNNDSLI